MAHQMQTMLLFHIVMLSTLTPWSSPRIPWDARPPLFMIATMLSRATAQA